MSQRSRENKARKPSTLSMPPDDRAGAKPHLVGLEVVGKLAQPLLEFTGLEARVLLLLLLLLQVLHLVSQRRVQRLPCNTTHTSSLSISTHWCKVMQVREHEEVSVWRHKEVEYGDTKAQRGKSMETQRHKEVRVWRHKGMER